MWTFSAFPKSSSVISSTSVSAGTMTCSFLCNQHEGMQSYLLAGVTSTSLLTMGIPGHFRFTHKQSKNARKHLENVSTSGRPEGAL